MTVGAAMAVETAQPPPPPLLVILGATASGKSALAMAVARRRTGAEILSADSMQVYRGMDVGTAKPTAAERREVRHHLLDLVGPDETFAVARFVVPSPSRYSTPVAWPPSIVTHSTCAPLTSVSFGSPCTAAR